MKLTLAAAIAFSLLASCCFGVIPSSEEIDKCVKNWTLYKPSGNDFEEKHCNRMRHMPQCLGLETSDSHAVVDDMRFISEQESRFQEKYPFCVPDNDRSELTKLVKASEYSPNSIMENITEEQVLSHLIILANGLPYELKWDGKDKVTEVIESVSGLVTVLHPVLDDSFACKNVLWLGAMNEDESFLGDEKLVGSNKTCAVLIPNNVYQRYIMWSNDKLWPLFHDRAQVSCEQLSENEWKGYKKVNEMYAEKAFKKSKVPFRQGQQFLIWIQDYPLMLVPELLRKKLSGNSNRGAIGFFLHIPFPSLASFERIPHFKEVLEGLLGSSMIAFHTEEFANNFLACCKKHCEVKDVDRKGHEWKLSYKGRIVLVRVIPAGISFHQLSRYSHGEFSELCPYVVKELLEITPNKTILLGVDRIDYTKGLPQKVQAFQSFLDQFPQLDDLIYVQIAVPCRKDNVGFKHLRSQLEARVDKTNKKLSDKGLSSRVVFIYDQLSQQDLAVLYQKADVAIVTPLHDGMNLVALEYTACQSGRTPGVLILSKFAGAAATMHEALKVDPNDEQDMVRALHDAINMSPEDRQNRMEMLQNRVRNQSAQRFVKDNVIGMTSSIEIKSNYL